MATPGKPRSVPDPISALTDLGNSERLVSQHGQDLRHVKQWGKWLDWDGTRWAADAVGRVTEMAKTTIRSLYIEAARHDREAERTAFARWAAQSEAAPRIDALIGLARSDPKVAIRPDDLDRDPWLLCCLNGTVDLRTGHLRPHDRQDLITRLAPVTYAPEAICPAWLAFLDRIMAGDASIISFLQRAIGYSLTGLTDERVLFIAYGPGGNGKTIFHQTVAALMGDYAARTPTDTLLVKRQGGIPNDVARLRGARFVYAAEAEDQNRLAEALVKDLTGGDRLVARFLHAEFFEFEPSFKLWLATNHKPVIKGTDRAIWDRIRLIPFDVVIPPADRVPRREMMARLTAELSGILTWAIQGCAAWQREGLGLPERVRVATTAYRDEQDVLGDFLSDCCVTGPTSRASARGLYGAYVQWCGRSGERPSSQKAFGGSLSERGFKRHRQATHHEWEGIGLVTDDRSEPVSHLFPSRAHMEKTPENGSSMGHGSQDEEDEAFFANLADVGAPTVEEAG